MGQAGAWRVHAVGGGYREFTGLPLGETSWPRGGEDTEDVEADAVDLVGGEDAEEGGDGGKAGLVVGEKGARESEAGRRRQGAVQTCRHREPGGGARCCGRSRGGRGPAGRRWRVRGRRRRRGRGGRTSGGRGGPGGR